MNEKVKLTEEQVNEIVDQVCDRLEKKLYLNIGKGIFGLIWRGIIILAVALASYGAGHGWFLK